MALSGRRSGIVLRHPVRMKQRQAYRNVSSGNTRAIMPGMGPTCPAVSARTGLANPPGMSATPH